MAADQTSVLTDPALKSAPGLPLLYGSGLIGCSLLLLLLSLQPVTDPILRIDPIVWLVAIAMSAGALYLLLCRKILAAEPQWTKESGPSGTLTWLLLVGLAMRLMLLPSEPLLENDYLRYLWDGGVVAAGGNPFAHAPQSILEGAAPDALQRLAGESQGLLESVTYPELRSIYPPVSQAAFLLANWLEPWSLMAWRTVILGCDLASLWLLMTLLRELRRPLAWAAVYWCNPLLVKEFFNSAHMDAVLVPFLLAALLLAVRSRGTWAAAALAVAAGCKVWPALLLPTVLRPHLAAWRGMAKSLLVFALLALLFAAPIVVTGLTRDSGFVAYGQSWQRNAAAFALLAWSSAQLLDVFSLEWLDAGRLARFMVALTVAAAAVGVNWRAAHDRIEIVRRCLFIAALLFLLSPTQYPWYFSWILPFLAILPSLPLLLLTALLPLYYLRFYFEATAFRDSAEMLLPWLQFGPVFALLAWQWLQAKVGRDPLHPPKLHDGAPLP